MSGAMSRNKGATAERDVVRFLRTVGFGGAERAVRTGYRTFERVAADPGDITGTPGIIWSVKDVAEDRARKDCTLSGWFAELDAMHGQPSDVRLLVHKRSGKSDPARWWCWMRLYMLHHVAQATASPDPLDGQVPVRMELGHVIPLLHAAGYGDAIEWSA